MSVRAVTKTNRLLAFLLAVSLAGGTAVGCAVSPTAPEYPEETTVDVGDMPNAVISAVPRITDVEDPEKSGNGFGDRLSLGLITDSAEPFTAEELDAVVEAIWSTLPWEPNTIKLVAGADTQQGPEIVDLRSAAADLGPLGVTDAGQAGVSLTGMDARYGAWTAPE